MVPNILLIDDQKIVYEALKEILEESGFSIFFCQDPSVMEQMVENCAPTVILQDLNIPGFDGFELIKKLKENEKSKNIPLIVLSSIEEAEKKATAFQKGANDYLVKLPDPVEVKARLKYHSDHFLHLQEKERAFRLLEESQANLRKELKEAEEYVTEILPKELETKEIRAVGSYTPSSSLGGDGYGFYFLDENHLCFFIIDVCGHGVGASLLCVSLIHTLQQRSVTGVDFKDPASVLSYLNRSYQMKHDKDLFFTVWYGVLNISNNHLIYASAGHPAAYLLENGSAVPILGDSGVACCIMEDSVYSNNEIFLKKGNLVLLYSDGAVELEKEGEISILDEKTFGKLIEESFLKDPFLENLKNSLLSYQKGSSFNDDVTFVTMFVK